MLLFLLFIHLLIKVASQTILEDILRDTDKFFEGLDGSSNTKILEETEKFKRLIRRSYGFVDGEEHLLEKRSLDSAKNSKLIHDEKGVFFVKNITRYARLPIKFPTDIKIVAGWEDNFYVVALESNGDLPRNRLANNLILYLLKEDGSWIELQRTQVAGGFRLGSSAYGNSIYLLSSEHDADVKNPFQGSSLYKISLYEDERAPLERIQILNVSHPRDVRFWLHQNQMYLAVGGGSDTVNRSFVFIFKWVKYNFDLIQKIEGSDVRSVTPFVIGSSMYLAVANHKDIYGNTNIDSKIFRFHLEAEKFVLYQRIKTQAAVDVSHFKFTDSKSGKEDNFIIVANYFERDYYDGSKKYRTDSVLFKFEDDYFVPYQNFKLLGIRQWVPVKGSQDEFLLLAICDFTIIGFQYNGWRFEEINLDFGQGSFGKEIFSISPFLHNKDVYISVADKESDGSSVNIWKIMFEHKNILEKQYGQVENWCNEMKSKIEPEDLNKLHLNLLGMERNFSGDTGDLGPLSPSGDTLNLENAEIDVLETESFDVYNTEIIDNLNNLNRKVKELKAELGDIKKKFDKTEFIIYYNVTGLAEIPDMELKCPGEDCCSFENLRIGTLNSIEFLSFINKIVSTDEIIKESKLEFENVRVSCDVTPIEINGHPSETLIDTNSDLFLNSKVIVNGSVIIQGNLRVTEKFINRFESELDILHKCFQNFTGDLVFDFARVKNLEINTFAKMNGIPVEKLLENTTHRSVNTFDKLVVQNLYVNGSISGLEPLENVGQNSENTGINQEFNLLELNDIFVESGSISGIGISDLVQIAEGRYFDFDGGLNISDSLVEPNYLQVEESINGIPADMFLNGNCSAVPKPKVTIVNGEAFVEDIVDEQRKYSLKRLVENGLSLNSSRIRTKLAFLDVNIDEALVESINGVPTSSWVLTNSDQIRIIRGRKTFSGHVTVQQSLNVEKLNGYDIQELYNNTLFSDGEQTVTGSVSFNGITVTRLDYNFISLDGNELQLPPKRIKIFGSVSVGKLTADNVIAKGLIDGLPFDEEDVLDPLNMKINEGERENSIKASLQKEEEEEEEEEEEWIDLELMHDVRFNKALHVQDLIFKGFLDSVPNSRFGKDWLLSQGDRSIFGHVIMENMKLNSGGILNNETINNINITNLFRDSIKVNETIRIKHLAANNIKAERIDVSLTVNGAKFDDSVVVAASENSQTVKGEWFLDRDLIIDGSLIIEGSVSGTDMSRVCKLGKLEPEEMNLVVGGSVRFSKEPKISVDVNGIDLKETAKEIWFGNENVILEGGENRKFCQVEIHGNVNLNGNMNNLDLGRVSGKYLSKTSTKIVSGKVKVRNLVIRDSCRIHNGTLKGKLNGIDLEKWSKTVLLQDEDQTITGRYSFNEFDADNLLLNGSINGLDMVGGVLRYDVPDSVITGEKTFLNLSINNLIMAEGKKLQEINVADWEKRVLKKNGNYTIARNLTLDNPIFKNGLKVSGNVNDIIFDFNHILVTTGNQTIKAEKTFDLRNYKNETLYIKNLIARAPVSHVNIDALIENQACNDRDLTFTGVKNFTGNLTVDNFKVIEMFQGENIAEICSTLLNPPRLVDFTQKYEKLFARARNINKNFKEGPFFLDYYEALQTINENVSAVLPFSSRDESLVCVINTFNEMKFMKWNSFTDQFSPKDEVIWSPSDNVTFATSVPTVESGPYVYLEIANTSHVFGSLAKIKLPVNGTSCVISFRLESLGKKLCFFVGRAWNNSKIFCNNADFKDFHIFQTLKTSGTEKASALQIGDEVYVTVINKEIMIDRIENILTIYKFDKEFKSFFVRSTLPVINPVAVSAITYKNHHFLALAGGHLPESVDTSIVTIFRLNKENDVFVRYQSLLVDTPIDVKFAELTTSELVLYVLSLNPTRPFIVFSFKGIRGFVEETSGPSLFVGKKVDSFTDPSGQHFVIITGYGRGQILRAGFKGNKLSVNN